MTAAVVTREQAGLRAPRSISHNITPEGSTLHWGGEGVGGWPWDHSRCASIWRAWQAFHMDTRGWVDIAYSAGVCPHEYIFQGRWLGVRTAAQGTDEGNQISHAIVAMWGKGDEAAFTDGAKRAFIDAAALFGGDHRWPHHFWHSTDCPGNVDAWLSAGMPAPGPAPAPAGGGKLAGKVVGIMASPDGGYAEIGSDGGVFAYGAHFWGSMGGHALTAPIVDGAYTPTGGGYWLVGADGGIFSFGDAHFFGSAGGSPIAAPITGMEPSPTGGGYWLVAEDGGVFAYGDARFLGRAG